MNHPAKYMAFTNDEEVRKEYYLENIELFKELVGASRVVIFGQQRSISAARSYAA